jgi:hypothetical protein
MSVFSVSFAEIAHAFVALSAGVTFPLMAACCKLLNENIPAAAIERPNNAIRVFFMFCGLR